MRLLRPVLIALLLIALPLQGIAAYAATMACADSHDARSEVHQHSAAMDAAHGSTVHDHQKNSQEPVDAGGGHSCCHHVATVALTVMISPPPEAAQVLVSRIPQLNTLHIPELPQRPPRA